MRTFADADLLVTVSEPWAAELSRLHPDRPVTCITNGYDQEDFGDAEESRTAAFTITHTGILYEGRRDPSLLFEAVSELLACGSMDAPSVRIRFIGEDEEWLRRLIRRHHLEGVVTVSGRVAREEALRLQRESQLLLLLRWDHAGEEGMHTAKIFEYLASRRPILAVGGPGGVVRELLETTGGGRFGGDREELKAIIMDYYREYRLAGEVRWQGNDRVADYSHEAIARRYAAALQGVVAGAGPAGEGRVR
jgi:glycosyltransferase involved in cell wall biosynthesis